MKNISTLARIGTFAIITAMMIGTVSCSKDDPADDFDQPTLSVDPVALSFTAQATESHKVNVTTNQPSWDAVSSQSWCIITKEQGRFNVTAVVNTSTSSPTPAVITVTAGNAKPVTVQVTQSGVVAELSVSVDTDIPVSFANTGGTSKTITVTTNQSSWNVVSNQTWCTIGKSGNTFEITTSANTASSERAATVIVSAGSAANITIEVKQAGSTPTDEKDDNLKKAAYCLAYTIQITEDLKKGNKPTSIKDGKDNSVLSVSYNANGSANHIAFNVRSPLTTATTSIFLMNTPVSICAVPANTDSYNVSNDIRDGKYDFTSDPAKIIVRFGSYQVSTTFTNLSNFRLVSNNEGITEDVYSKISLPANTYKALVYSKDKNGKLIGKYVGYSSAAGNKFTYWYIDPDDSSYGKSSTIDIP